MLRYILRRALAAFETRYAYNVDHLRAIADVDAPGALRIQIAQALAARRFGLPVEVYFAGLLVAVRAADCGACLDLVMKMACRAGVPRETVRAVVLEEVREDDPIGVGLAAAFARAVVTWDYRLDELGDAVQRRWGVRGRAGPGGPGGGDRRRRVLSVAQTRPRHGAGLRAGERTRAPLRRAAPGPALR
ncbi:MAG: hypothetical protein O3C65_15650 [Proteobacteria bacterium]|nr:hypothetical protein [Pseudomonadota bacterium]MDA1060109.1 hypothetical protein [Pseudomonadota bacterium]